MCVAEKLPKRFRQMFSYVGIPLNEFFSQFVNDKIALQQVKK